MQLSRRQNWPLIEKQLSCKASLPHKISGVICKKGNESQDLAPNVAFNYQSVISKIISQQRCQCCTLPHSLHVTDIGKVRKNGPRQFFFTKTKANGYLLCQRWLSYYIGTKVKTKTNEARENYFLTPMSHFDAISSGLWIINEIFFWKFKSKFYINVSKIIG